MFGDAFKDAINLLIALAIIGAIALVAAIGFGGFMLFKHFVH